MHKKSDQITGSNTNFSSTNFSISGSSTKSETISCDHRKKLFLHLYLFVLRCTTINISVLVAIYSTVIKRPSSLTSEQKMILIIHLNDKNHSRIRENMNWKQYFLVELFQQLFLKGLRLIFPLLVLNYINNQHSDYQMA